MTTAVQTKLIFIGGQWVSSAGGETQPMISPATGETIAVVSKGTDEDVDRAVAAARKAFEDDWCDTTPGERSLMLWRLAQALEDHRDEFVRLESLKRGQAQGGIGGRLRVHPG